jgi:hypothetical protein
MEKEVESVKKRETELKESIISRLDKADDKGAAGLRYLAKIVMNDVYRVTDWPAFHGWILGNARLDMLQKRLGEKAMGDFVEHTRTLPPGVELIHVPDVSITKL